MNANVAAPLAERPSIFSYGRELRPTELALREHRAELAKATTKVEQAAAAADNLRNQLRSAEAAAEAAKASLVDQRTASLLAEQAAGAYGADADPRDRKLRVTAEKNHLDATVSAEATQRALTVAESAVRDAQAGLNEVHARATELVLQELAEQHREALERLRDARAQYLAAEADVTGLAMAVGERGRAMHEAGHGVSWLQLAERMNVALVEQGRSDQLSGNRAHSARDWTAKIVRLLAGAE
jgi:hypothetical protein